MKDYISRHHETYRARNVRETDLMLQFAESRVETAALGCLIERISPGFRQRQQN
jgi:hypothetical protein